MTGIHFSKEVAENPVLRALQEESDYFRIADHPPTPPAVQREKSVGSLLGRTMITTTNRMIDETHDA
jgi:hypothetical protein